MDANRRQEVFERYCEIYNVILSNMYPAKNSTGFPERNLSVNFSKAYEAVAKSAGEMVISWFEMQFGAGNNLHIDAVIINETVGDMLIVESKRFSDTEGKPKEVAEDIRRIFNFIKELQDENKKGEPRIDLSKIKNRYGVILADVWVKTDGKTGGKKEILNSYIAGVQCPKSPESFLNKYCKEDLKDRDFPNLVYNVYNMRDISFNDYNFEKYNLVSLIWQIT
ncbi:MAG: hypothetical protein K2J80_00670 [Oscillospiraceae bacterium]|nr:hypothetical protein [Oscillospiraceae bacterium]